MNWQYIEYEGQRYSLEHLDQLEFEAVQAATKTRPEIRTTIKVSFGWHCFTRSPGPDETTRIHRDPRGEERCFCPTRYEHSKRLPEIIKDLSQRKVLQTGKGNYLLIELIGEQGQIEQYEIYFSLRKPGKKQALKLYVESAYIRDPSEHSKRQKSKQQAISFAVLVYKVKNDQKIPYKK